MTPDEIKEKWRSLDDAIPDNNRRSPATPFYLDRMIDNVTSGRVTSARDRLIRRYRMMFTVVAPLGLISLIPLRTLLPLWGSILGVVFYIAAFLMEIHLYKGIKGIDLSTDGVDRVARKARRYRRRHHLFQVCLIPLAAAFISACFVAFNEEAMRWILSGGIGLGLIAGLAIYFQIMRDYRQLL